MGKLKQIVALLTIITVVFVFSVPVLAEETGKININIASVEELAKLKRVGPKYAALIVEYREANGPFKSPEDLMQVRGIGKKTLEDNKDVIVVE